MGAMAQDCTELPSGNTWEWVQWLTECCDTEDMTAEDFFAPWSHAERCLSQMGNGAEEAPPPPPPPPPPPDTPPRGYKVHVPASGNGNGNGNGNGLPAWALPAAAVAALVLLVRR